MSTTQANLPATDTKEGATPAAPSLSYGRPAAAGGDRLSRWWLLTPVVVIAVCLGAWGSYRNFFRPTMDGNISLYTVKRTSFPIVLKEKGELKAHKSVDIKCEIEGGSTIIWIVPEGTTVKEGDELIKLAYDTIEQKIRQQKITVNTAKNTYEAADAEFKIQLNKNAADIDTAETYLELATIDLEKWEDGDQIQQEQEAELKVESSTSRLQQATEQLEVTERMYRQSFVTAVELEEDRLKKQEADFALRNAKKALVVLRGYTFRKDRITYESAVRDAKASLERIGETAKVEEKRAKNNVERTQEQLDLVLAELDKYEEQLAKATVRAPQPGLVVYHAERHRGSSTIIDAGAKVYQNQKILELPDLSQMKMVVRIHESDAERIKPGLPVRIKVAGIYEEIEADTESGNGASGEARTSGAQKIFEGEVAKIAALADTRNRWLNPELREFETEIMLTGNVEGLKPGVTAEAEIYIDHVEDVLAVPVQAVYSRAGHSYVFVGEEGRRPEYREIQLGASSTSFVEVFGNLSANEKVWMTISDEMLTLLPAVSKKDGESQRQLRNARQQFGNDSEKKSVRDNAPSRGNRTKDQPERPAKERSPGAKRPPHASTRPAGN